MMLFCIGLTFSQSFRVEEMVNNYLFEIFPFLNDFSIEIAQKEGSLNPKPIQEKGFTYRSYIKDSLEGIISEFVLPEGKYQEYVFQSGVVTYIPYKIELIEYAGEFRKMTVYLKTDKNFYWIFEGLTSMTFNPYFYIDGKQYESDYSNWIILETGPLSENGMFCSKLIFLYDD